MMRQLLNSSLHSENMEYHPFSWYLQSSTGQPEYSNISGHEIKISNINCWTKIVFSVWFPLSLFAFYNLLTIFSTVIHMFLSLSVNLNYDDLVTEAVPCSCRLRSCRWSASPRRYPPRSYSSSKAPRPPARTWWWRMPRRGTSGRDSG